MKTELRSLWKTNKLSSYDILHINDFFNETIDYSTIYLNNNSIKFLNQQNIQNFINISSNREFIYINTLKKILYENFSQQNISRFIFISSFILYIFGLRKMNDIDGFILDNPTLLENKKFNNIYSKLFDITSNSFIPFLDVLYKKSNGFKEK